LDGINCLSYSVFKEHEASKKPDTTQLLCVLLDRARVNAEVLRDVLSGQSAAIFALKRELGVAVRHELISVANICWTY